MKLIVLNEQLLGQDPAALSLGLLGATEKRDNAVTFPRLPGKTTWVGAQWTQYGGRQEYTGT